MIKVLEHGILHTECAKMRCPACDCLFNYTASDIRKAGGVLVKNMLYVICPECEQTCVIKKEFH